MIPASPLTGKQPAIHPIREQGMLLALSDDDVPTAMKVAFADVPVLQKSDFRWETDVYRDANLSPVRQTSQLPLVAKCFQKKSVRLR